MAMTTGSLYTYSTSMMVGRSRTIYPVAAGKGTVNDSVYITHCIARSVYYDSRSTTVTEAEYYKPCTARIRMDTGFEANVL